MPLSIRGLSRLSFSDYLKAVVLNYPNSASADSGVFTLPSGPVDLGEVYSVTDTLSEEFFSPVETCYGDTIATYVIRRLRRACNALRHRYRLSPLIGDFDTLEILSGRVASRPCRPADLPGVLALLIVGKVYGRLCDAFEFGGFRIEGQYRPKDEISIPLRFRSLGIEL